MNSAGTPNHSGHDDATYNTALRGAFLAFQKTTTNPTANSPSTPTPTRNTGNGHGNGNGALLAATSASRDRSLVCSPSLSRQTTGDNRTPSRDHHPSPQHHPTILQTNLLPPAKSATGDPRSPSLIAATLAASRSASPNVKTAPSVQLNAHQPAREHRKGNVGDDSTASSVADLDLTTDSSSIGPTNALVSLFERKEDEIDPVKKKPALSISKKGPRTGLRPMTPPRTMSPVVTYDTSPSRLASSFAWEKAALPSLSIGRDTVKVKPPLRNAGRPSESKRQRPPTPPARIKVDAELPVSTSLPNSKRKPRPVTPPSQAINQTNSLILSPQPRRTPSQRIVTTSSDTSPTPTPPMKSVSQRQTQTSGTTVPPVASFVGEKGPGNLVRRSSSSLSNDTFVSASSAPSPQPNSPRKSPQRPTHPVHALSVLPHSRPPASRSTSNLPLDSLTNAIVAGSLASARATPSMAKPPTPPPRKQTPHMRQTLRAPRAKSEEEVTGIGPQHKRKPLGRLSSRKKHAHHEGARKRWREEIRARERQRYEGVWASNRGLLLDSPSAVAKGLRDIDTSQLVANVVARDIWARSRLPFDELAEVWDLVDTQGKGALDRAQFVVGMWLIDQRLRGRKIPRKVSDSVWGSAKGVRVPNLKRR
ncbi:hypothetical protein E0Z10_g8076 [Xylaria hypoxylon]|uniref:EH domain-containing protein n=1 Tax=Xylaria hypoxylon TaxID=37992 RepID=A0A4Z0YNH5_9PEZI|nr:hypothetical protein E0Z10_g8076 [Xylaria hypoxylon]